MFNITDTITTISPSAPSREAAGRGLAQINYDWHQLISIYISQKDCSPSSRKAYSKALVPFFKWLDKENRAINALTEKDILDYKNYLIDSGHAPMTVSLYMVSIKGFYEWAEANKLYPNIARGVKTLRKSQTGDKFVKMHLDDEQGAMLLKHFRESESLRDYALINLMIRTGLRSVEVYRANIGDICVKGKRTILKVQGKGKLDKSDFVVLSPSALGPLEDYLATRKGALLGEPLFVCEGRGSAGRRLSTRSIQLIGKRGLRAIGLDGHEYSVHSLRHTAGVQILKHGGTQFDVQDVLRHASPVTSQIYLESIKEERRIESAPEELLEKAFRPADTKSTEPRETQGA